VARRIADRRVAGLSGGALTYQVLGRVPVGTAATEEFAFRGVLFAVWLQHGLVRALIASSVALGLWHISPTINMVRANRPEAGAGHIAGAVAVAVVATAAAGALLVWLRHVTGSLVAPWAIHATLNSTATLVATRAHRTLEAGNNV
jgi:membrane protease YdiL (CAAX protease family)